MVVFPYFFCRGLAGNIVGITGPRDDCLRLLYREQRTKKTPAGNEEDLDIDSPFLLRKCYLTVVIVSTYVGTIIIVL